MAGQAAAKTFIASELDKAKRSNNYAFYGIDHKTNNTDKYHGDDWVVSTNSQVADDLEDVCWRFLWKKEYKENDTDIGAGKPHSLASKPENCQEVVMLLKKLLKGEEIPKLAIGEKPSSSNDQPYVTDTDALPYAISNVSIWYFMTNDNISYLKLKGTIENKTAKPLTLKLSDLVQTSLGNFYGRDEETPTMVLTPMAKRPLLLKRNQTNIEVQSEKAQVFMNKELSEIQVFYLPLPLSESSVMPTESIWNLEITDLKATNRVKDNGTEVIIEAGIVNNSMCTFELHNWSLITKIDTDTEHGDYGIEGNVFSWIAEHKFLKIAPKATTSLLLYCGFRSKGNPTMIKLIIGSPIMPAFEENIPVQ